MTGKVYFLLLLLPLALITACSDDGDGTAAEENTSVETIHAGHFLDAAVSDLDYETLSQKGITDTEGTFQYKTGEEVILYLGGIRLGSALGQKVLTPLEITDAQRIDDPEAMKVLRLLQSIDADKNSSNGISVTEGVINAAKGMETSLHDEDNVTALLEQLGILPAEIVSEADALTHFTTTLSELDSAEGSLADGLVLHLPFTLNAQNISSTDITIQEKNVTIDGFTLNMVDNDINITYATALEPRSITISFWAKSNLSTDTTDEVLFVLHDGKSDYLTDQTSTTTRYKIVKGNLSGENTIGLSMSYPLVDGSNIKRDAIYYIQNKSNILSTETWHHFAFTYSPDVDMRVDTSSVVWDDATQSYVTLANEGRPGAVWSYYDGVQNMIFIHKITLNDVDYYEPSDMNATVNSLNKFYDTPTFLFPSFNGSIDDLRIYNRVLSEEEVLSLSQERK